MLPSPSPARTPRASCRADKSRLRQPRETRAATGGASPPPPSSAGEGAARGAGPSPPPRAKRARCWRPLGGRAKTAKRGICGPGRAPKPRRATARRRRCRSCRRQRCRPRPSPPQSSPSKTARGPPPRRQLPWTTEEVPRGSSRGARNRPRKRAGPGRETTAKQQLRQRCRRRKREEEEKKKKGSSPSRARRRGRARRA